ncbi:MAG: apolipoprotein N-acyltransferase, partial [Nitriliruptoraceae bacterium]
RVLGARGITAFTVAIGVATLVLLRTGVRVVREDGLDGFARVLPRARVPTVLLVVSLAGSALVVADPPATDGSLRVLVVQGNDIRHWQQPVDDPVTRIATNLHADTLDALASGRDPDVVVWPESAIDRDPTRTTNAALAEIIADVAARPPELLAGTTLDGPDPAHTRYVAVSHYTDSGTAVDRYVKRRLVPFGEYVPARRLIGWFPPLAQVPRDALAGQGPQQFVVGDDVRIATVICFETLFGALVRDNVRGDGDYAHLVVATTNDASFRDSAEPAQHLAQSRMRAVETGRWVVHASLSGSSAFVDPNGVAHDTSPLFTRATIAREVPLATSATPFLVIGDLLGWITRAIVAVLLLAVLVGARRRASRRPSANR